MNNAGMDGYSYESETSHGETLPPLLEPGMGYPERNVIGTMPTPTYTVIPPRRNEKDARLLATLAPKPSHGETHEVTATDWAADVSVVRVTCSCGWRTRSSLLSVAMGKHNDHRGVVTVAATARKIGAEAMSA